MQNHTTEHEAPPQKDKGFTLIELIIVIVILGILTTVVVLAVGGLRGEAENATCTADAEAILTASEAYAVLPVSNGDYPTVMTDLTGANLLRAPSELWDFATASSASQITLEGQGTCSSQSDVVHP